METTTYSFIFTPTNSEKFEQNAFKYYLGNFCILDEEDNVLFSDTVYHLIDHEEGQNSITKELPTYSKPVYFQFNLGVDSLNNVSGILDGDLDPSLGMYWSWQSGYINFKFEGGSKNDQRVYHLGGYLSPNLCVQQIKFPLSDTKLNIQFAVDEFLEESSKITTKDIMSPGSNAVEISKCAAKSFYLVK